VATLHVPGWPRGASCIHRQGGILPAVNSGVNSFRYDCSLKLNCAGQGGSKARILYDTRRDDVSLRAGVGVHPGRAESRGYLPAVKKAWYGLTQSLSPQGKVLWGQSVDDQPHPVTLDSTHEYDTGAFLLAAAALQTRSGGVDSGQLFLVGGC
jgi:hypothetical protein